MTSTWFKGCRTTLIDVGLVIAELNFELALSTLELARMPASRCKMTVLNETDSTKGSTYSLDRGERSNQAIQGQVRALRAQVMQSCARLISGVDRRLMVWIDWFQTESDARTAYTHT